jgi:hypothetical protein
MRKGPPAPINYPIEEWDGLDHLREHGIATVTDLLESFFYFFNKEIESTDCGYLGCNYIYWYVSSKLK